MRTTSLVTPPSPAPRGLPIGRPAAMEGRSEGRSAESSARAAMLVAPLASMGGSAVLERPAPPSVPAPPSGPSGHSREPVTPRAFICRCGRPIFFRNSQCLGCRTPLGYDPAQSLLMPLELAAEATVPSSAPPVSTAAGGAAVSTAEGGKSPALWRQFGAPQTAPRFCRCANLGSAAGCNWLVAEADTMAGSPPLCRCCRLTRTLPDLSVQNNPLWWSRIELAKRRLVSSLIGLKLPVLSKMNEDPARGLVFDLLRAQPGGPPVVTGHDDGVITIDVEEADDAWREQRRAALAEPYRTLLGHLRHESGHYYWQRLVEHSDFLGPWRETFGDERQDYTAALQKHYQTGAPADWGSRFVSAYASSHPWEDWAETWAHYLHLVDTLDTARSFGLDGEHVELSYERFGADVVGPADAHAPDSQAGDFLRLINGWMELTGVLNELSRSMGMADFYPFVLSAPAVRKLFFVHRVIASAPR